MRHFSCLTFSQDGGQPVTSKILTADPHRARLLACRELMDTDGAQRVEIFENGELIAIERRSPAPRGGHDESNRRKTRFSLPRHIP